jgi:hypothetical protein
MLVYSAYPGRSDNLKLKAEGEAAVCGKHADTSHLEVRMMFEFRLKGSSTVLGIPVLAGRASRLMRSREEEDLERGERR